MSPEVQYVYNYRAGVMREWWKQSFCVEIDWRVPVPYPRLATAFQRPLTADNFTLAIQSLMTGMAFPGRIDEFVDYIRHFGNLRLRPGHVWAVRYMGDYFDFAIAMDPFSFFPFGPLVEHV